MVVNDSSRSEARTFPQILSEAYARPATTNSYTFYVIRYVVLLEHKYFLGQLCIQHQAHTFQTLENQSLSFIPDIYRILIKYALHHVLDRYLLDGVFPSKCAWKRIIDQKTIQRSNTELFHECVESFPTCAPSILRSDGVSCICTMTSYCKELSSI